MACFIVPAAEAVVTTIATKVMEKKEHQAQIEAEKNGTVYEVKTGEKFSAKLKRLNGLLWGGSALLAFEHVWHGEVQPFFPFLTATGNPADFAAMLHEMSTAGVGMAAVVTAVWGVVTVAADQIARRDEKTVAAEETL